MEGYKYYSIRPESSSKHENVTLIKAYGVIKMVEE